MKFDSTMKRIEQSARVQQESTETSPMPTTDERASLVRAMHFEAAELPAGRGQPPTECDLFIIRTKPAHELTFADLDALSKVSDQEMNRRWQELKAAARDELSTGWRAGQAVEGSAGTAWDRASYLAARDALHATWPPRSPGESILLEELAQYEFLRMRWIRTLAAHTSAIQTLHRQKPREADKDQPTISQAAATREAMLMIDRLQRLSQRTLKMLITVRRGNPSPIIVRQAGQINVTNGPQMNLADTVVNRDGVLQTASDSTDS